MPVTFEPYKRLEHLEEYILKIGIYLPIGEARIQLLRCRLVAYSLIAEIDEKAYDKEFIDQLFAKAYQSLSLAFGIDIRDPYEDPCKSQYMILDELRSYLARNSDEPFMRFIRAEFKKVFVPTIRLMTDLCKSEKKYSWDEAKGQLLDIMNSLNVDVTWDECEEKLERYLEKITPMLKKM